MAGLGYRSPQFSEDTAWLPPWLQPHQLPAFDDHTKGEQTVSPLAWKNPVSSQENICKGQDVYLSTMEDAGYSSCQLFISGEDSSTMGSTPGNALHFHLHLSSVSPSPSSGQLNKMTPIKNSETRRCQIDMSEKPASEIPTVKQTTVCMRDVENCAYASKTSPVEPGIGSSPWKPIDRDEKKKKFQKTVYGGNLKKTCVDDVVELSIAAAEAMVISEMVSSSMHSDPVLAAAILEVALRVKEARKECCLDVSEVVPGFSSNELGETDQFTDLDDNIMKDAFDDIGLSFNQIAANEVSYTDGESSPNSQQLFSGFIPSTPSNASIIDIHDQHRVKALGMKLPAQDDVHRETIPRIFVTSVIKNPDPQNVKPRGYKEDGMIFQVAKATAQGNANVRQIKGLFIQETSFISEFMDITDKHTSEQKSNAGSEVVASSTTPFHIVADDVKQTCERSFLSQDLVISSILSSADPLCSLVPCSIPLEDAAPVANQNGTEPVASQDLNEKCSVSNPPYRKRSNSLKSYSTVMPDKDKVGDTSPGETSSLKNIKNSISSVPAKEHQLPLCSIGKCMEKDRKEYNCYYASKYDGQVGGPSATDDDTSNPNCKHEDRHKSHMLNNKTRRSHLWPCKAFLRSGKEEDRVERSKAAKMKNCAVKSFTNLDSCRDQINGASDVPPHSTLKFSLGDKRCFPSEKVRFLEAELSASGIEGSRRLQSRHSVHGSDSRKRKRTKGSSLLCKAGIGKQKCRYLRNFHSANGNNLIFQGLEFLLTGFSAQKGKSLEVIIREFGGYVLSSIPSCTAYMRGKKQLECLTSKLPIILSPKKVKSTKFLYGCAINTWLLSAEWLLDSVEAGSLLAPRKYINRPLQASERIPMQVGEPFCINNFIFDKLGVMTHGKASFCAKFSKIIKHGGGQVYKSLQPLVQSLKNGKNSMGVILVEDESNVSRHLKQCAIENNLQTMTASWIVNSLFSGKLLPFKKNQYAPLHRIKMPTFPQDQSMDISQEI